MLSYRIHELNMLADVKFIITISNMSIHYYTRTFHSRVVTPLRSWISASAVTTRSQSVLQSAVIIVITVGSYYQPTVIWNLKNGPKSKKKLLQSQEAPALWLAPTPASWFFTRKSTRYAVLGFKLETSVLTRSSPNHSPVTTPPLSHLCLYSISVPLYSLFRI
jgi:hypothetical protein